MKFNWENILSNMGGNHQCGTSPKSLPAAWTTDSRTIKEGEWFVPLVGEHFDGHTYIDQAVARGASGFFYNHASKLTFKRDGGIGVGDTLLAYGQTASLWRQSFENLTCIGITGSNGKTTVKELTGLCVKSQFNSVVPKESFNNEVGVPKTLLELTSDSRIGVFEMGARKPGDIKYLTDLVRPNIAAILNIGTAHLGIFGSKEVLRKTKLELFTHSPQECLLAVNSDDEKIRDGVKGLKRNQYTYSLRDKGCFAFLDTFRFEGGLSHFSFFIDGKRLELSMPYYHTKLAANLLPTLTMSYLAGVSFENMSTALSSFRGQPGRFFIVECGEQTLVDDCYNANPDSTLEGVLTLSKLFDTSKACLILGDMLELGESSASEHYNLGKNIIDLIKPARIITVGTHAKEIARGARAGDYNEENLSHFDHVDELNENLDLVKTHKVCYLKGSNAMGLKKTLAHLRESCQ